jgi:hypothetical protein
MKKKPVPAQKRQPTVLRINSSNNGKLILKQKGQENSFENIVFTEMLDAIESVNSNESVDLFEIKNSYVYITLDREFFPKVLVKALNYFEKAEEFEKCSRCKKLLETIKL